MSNKVGFACFAVSFLIWVVAFFPTMSTVFLEWGVNSAYSHGPLSLLLAAWFFWNEKAVFSRFSNDKGTIWVAAGLGFGLLWLVSSIADVLLIEQVSAFFIWLAALAFFFGWRIVLALRSGFFLVLLSMPVWGWLQIPLREISAAATVFIVDLLGIPVFYSAYNISVSGGNFYIAPACSGLGFFLVSMIVACYYAYIKELKGVRAWGFAAYAIFLAVLSNCIRIIAIVLVGNETQMQHVIVQDHLTFGWVVYAVMMLSLFWVGSRYFISKPESV